MTMATETLFQPTKLFVTSTRKLTKTRRNIRKMNAPFALGLAALGVAIGLGMIGQGAMNGMSRQPEAIGKMQTAMLIALAFVELVFLLTVFVGMGPLTAK
jgi:F-type H+-transporting ATPase subunit c